MRRSDRCTRRKSIGIFRSPAYNFDPVNTMRQQHAYEAAVRPLVESANVFYLDNFRCVPARSTPPAAPPAPTRHASVRRVRPRLIARLSWRSATYRAAFQPAPSIKFARGSTFHYLDAGRHLMAQSLLHLFALLARQVGAAAARREATQAAKHV